MTDSAQAGYVRYKVITQLDVNSGIREVVSLEPVSWEGVRITGKPIILPVPEYHPGRPVRVTNSCLIDIPVMVMVPSQ